MKKFSVFSLIFSLIFLTALIKNSTKRIDEEIFTKKENILELKKELGSIELEFEYLSSAERLIELNDLYFDGKLVKKKIQEIKVIKIKPNNLQLKQLNQSLENEK